MEVGLGRRQAASRRKALVFAASVAALTYYAHRRRWASRARAAVTPLALAVGAYRDAALTSGRLCAALVGDLSAFLSSTDAHAEVPASLRQLLRLATCSEAQAAVSTLGRSLTDGLASGVAAAVQAPSGGRALLENALDAASTEQGRSLLACVVSAAARQAVAVALEASERTAAHAPGPDSDTLDRVLGELDTDRGRRVAQDVIGALVRGAVSTYLSSTDDVTYADSLLDAVSRPEHRDAVNELAERVTGGGLPMEHNRALLGGDSSGGPGDESSQHNGGGGSPQERVSPGSTGGSSTRSGASLRDGGSIDGTQAGWVSTARVALNLASAPEARALIRDVAGAAAGAAVKSLVYAVPGAIYSSLPSLPFRRRAAAAPPQASAAPAAAAAAALVPAANNALATPWERIPPPGGAPPWRQPPSTEVMVHHNQPGRNTKRMPRIGSYGDSGDEDDTVWHDASPVPIIPQDWALATSTPPSGPSSPTDGSAAGSSGSGAAFWRGMDSARVSQGALAAALLVHSVALAPGAAARLGML